MMKIQALVWLIMGLCHLCMHHAHADTLRVVAFGNSVTAPRKGIEKVYAARIQEKLHEAGICSQVINSGVPSSHSGSITENNFAKVRHGMDRFQTDVLSHNPNWVIISFGLNDA